MTAVHVLPGVGFCLSQRIAAFLAGSLALTVDLVTFYDVFIHPTHSTAAIGLLFAPPVNLFVVPFGLLLGWGLSRLFRSQPTT